MLLKILPYRTFNEELSLKTCLNKSVFKRFLSVKVTLRESRKHQEANTVKMTANFVVTVASILYSQFNQPLLLWWSCCLAHGRILPALGPLLALARRCLKRMVSTQICGCPANLCWAAYFSSTIFTSSPTSHLFTWKQLCAFKTSVHFLKKILNEPYPHI